MEEVAIKHAANGTCDQSEDRQGARPTVPPTLLTRADELTE
jgi:hypothetical protein